MAEKVFIYNETTGLSVEWQLAGPTAASMPRSFMLGQKQYAHLSGTFVPHEHAYLVYFNADFLPRKSSCSAYSLISW
jgi:hypothetical protein